MDSELKIMFHGQGVHQDWLGGEKEALEGFSWRGGSERDTTGILIWSKPYLRTLANGEEVSTVNCSSVLMWSHGHGKFMKFLLEFLGGGVLPGSQRPKYSGTSIKGHPRDKEKCPFNGGVP